MHASDRRKGDNRLSPKSEKVGAQEKGEKKREVEKYALEHGRTRRQSRRWQHKPPAGGTSRQPRALCRRPSEEQMRILSPAPTVRNPKAGRAPKGQELRS